MLVTRAFHILAIFAIVAVAVAAPMLTAPAEATHGRGTIVIHSRLCPLDAVQLFRDCHGNPGPFGARYTVDQRVPKNIAIDTGNVSFGGVRAGDHLVRIMSGFPAAYSHLRVFCSNTATGTGPNEATVRFSGGDAIPEFWVRLAPDSRLICDVYFVP
jgi:hypothetical protein